MPEITNRDVKIAAVQAAPVSFDLAKSLIRVKELSAEAVAQGAQIVVFPEGFLSGYPWRYTFDVTIGARKKRGREWYARYYESAVGIPSPECDELAKIAKTNKIYLQVGIIERDGGTLYCTAVLFDKNGSILYRHRKLVPTGAERLVWGRGSGDGLTVVNTEIGKVGSLICWENYMPAARLSLYQQGIEIYLAPTADDVPVWTATMQHIAKEGRCFVISVNQFCKVSDMPPDYPPITDDYYNCKPDGSKWDPDEILSRGGSCVVGPLGNFVAEPVWDKEEIIYADLRMRDLVEARMDFDPVGSYSRPDIFSLTVNTSPAVNVRFEAPRLG